MNAELVLFLMEEGYDLAKAKDIVEAVGDHPGSAGEFALALLEALPGALTVAEARDTAARAPLGKATIQPRGQEKVTPVERVQPPQPDGPLVHGTYVPVVGPDGLTDRQRAARGSLCPNCQQPNTDHLPGCARVSRNALPPADPRAVTKDRLPPAV